MLNHLSRLSFKISFWALWSIALSYCELKAQDNAKSYSLTKMKLNSKMSDISPVILENGIAFVSNREDDLMVTHLSKSKSEPFFKLFYSIKIDDSYQKPIRISGEVNGDFSEGPISFTSDNKQVFFTRNIPNNKSASAGKKASLGLFVGDFSNNSIHNIKPFPYNKAEYSLAHPAVSANGNFLLFASNLPGGYGGSDLYVTYLKNGTWEKPINLGKDINTKNNEVFPFVNDDGKLFFASDGHNSIGGLDIFTANYQNFEWKEVTNLGTPFNSQNDDFGYVESKDKTYGFICSGREGNSKDDIYQFELSTFMFDECDTLRDMSYCRTFYEEGTMNTDSLPLMYEWDFGNGIKKRGLEVHHCFEKAGNYKINLNIIDLVTNQLYMNEASYDINIEPIKGPYFTLSDTSFSNTELDLNASKSFLDKTEILDYFWDFGDGHLKQGIDIQHFYKTTGTFFPRLGVRFRDSTTSNTFSKCVVKKVTIIEPNTITNRKKVKPFYEIRDKKGNTYKIQIATSEAKLDLNAYYFKEVGQVEEYYDRGVFGYTVGNFDRPDLCYPELKRVRQKGFKEAMVIAMKDNKVVSGNDTSFFVKLPKNFKFVRVVSMHGKVMDHNGKPVSTIIKLEELYSGIFLDEFKTDSISGTFKIDLPLEKAYAYYIYQNGYFPFSNFIDLTQQNDLSEIRSDIFLMGLDKMRKDSLSMRINNIFFEIGEEVKLKPESRFELNRLSNYFKLYPNAHLVIDSHTDNLGDKYSKKILSEQRAQLVKGYLEANDCDGERIILRAFGETKPITLNPKLQHLNNRIEMRTILAR
jgi:outer membrane protein OmpA-like peptidoglycan-associated protein